VQQGTFNHETAEHGGKMHQQDQLMTAKEVAQRLGLTVNTLATWRCSHPGRLAYVKLANRTIRYRRADVEAFVNSRLVGGGSN
jgi:predicted DNA-binding transcriptional regulator AlpA